MGSDWIGRGATDASNSSFLVDPSLATGEKSCFFTFVPKRERERRSVGGVQRTCWCGWVCGYREDDSKARLAMAKKSFRLNIGLAVCYAHPIGESSA